MLLITIYSWFPGIFGGEQVQTFLNAALMPKSPLYPDLPVSFTLSLVHPFTFGSRGGIKPIQLSQPYKLAKIQVTRSTDNMQWTLKTRNIRRFGFADFAAYNVTKDWYPTGTEQKMFVLNIDQQSFEFSTAMPSYEKSHFCMDATNTWQLCSGSLNTLNERLPSTYGPAKQVFDHSPFVIVYGTQKPEMIAAFKDAAVYLANSMYYRGRHSPYIFADTEFLASALLVSNYNVILLGGAESNSVASKYPNKLTQWSNDAKSFQLNGYTLNMEKDNIGMLMLQPFLMDDDDQLNRLALVVTGSNVAGFKVAVKAFPGVSGVLVPDYMIVSDEMLWKGDGMIIILLILQGGIVAAGYYGNTWTFRQDLSFVDTIVAQAPYVSPWSSEAVLGMVYFVTIGIIIIIVSVVFTVQSVKSERQQQAQQAAYAQMQ